MLNQLSLSLSLFNIELLKPLFIDNLLCSWVKTHASLILIVHGPKWIWSNNLNLRSSTSLNSQSLVLLIKLLILNFILAIFSTIHAFLLKFIQVLLLMMINIFLFHPDHLFGIFNWRIASVDLFHSFICWVNSSWWIRTSNVHIWFGINPCCYSTIINRWLTWIVYIFIILISLIICTVILIRLTILRACLSWTYPEFEACHTVFIFGRKNTFNFSNIFHRINLWQTLLGIFCFYLLILCSLDISHSSTSLRGNKSIWLFSFWLGDYRILVLIFIHSSVYRTCSTLILIIRRKYFSCIFKTIWLCLLS